MQSKEAKDHYDCYAKRYDRMADGPQQWKAPEALFGEVSQTFNLHQANLRVLDLGIGTGRLSAMFRAANPKCYIAGTDISPKMLAATKSKNIADELIEAPLEGLPLSFPDKSFDIIVSSGVFEWIDDMKPVIAEISRLLKPHGAFSFTTHSHAETINNKKTSVSVNSGDWLKYHAPEDIEAMMRRNALERKSLKTIEAYRYGLSISLPFFNIFIPSQQVYYHLHTGRKNLPQP